MRKDLSNTDLPFDLEHRRIRALETLNILDTPKEELFDRHTRLIQRVLNTPIAWFSLIDENRVCYKSSQGILLDDTPRADNDAVEANDIVTLNIGVGDGLDLNDVSIATYAVWTANPSPVPLPASIYLFTLALSGVLLFNRRVNK